MHEVIDADLPIKAVRAWLDSKGHLHPTKDAALYAEIERLLGHLGSGESLAPGIARLMVEKRETLINLLSAFGTRAEEIDVIPLMRSRSAAEASGLARHVP